MKRKSKSKEPHDTGPYLRLAAAIMQPESEADPLAKYYLQWRQNCLDSIRWLAGLEVDPQIPCNYGWEEIEWLVEYYEHRAMLHWCAAVRAGVV